MIDLSIVRIFFVLSIFILKTLNIFHRVQKWIVTYIAINSGS